MTIGLVLSVALIGAVAALEEPVSALAVTEGPGIVATAYPTGESTSKIVLVRRDEPASKPEELAIPATVRALAFVGGDRALYAIVAKEHKRRPTQTTLVAIDLETLDSSRVASLSPSAQALTEWTRGHAIVVASQDELRTFLPPDHRSGPLFRVPGVNRAILVLPDSDVVLIGKDLGVVAIDLGDPHRDNEMPIRASFETSSPPVALTLVEGGRTVAVRLEDGRIVSTPIESLRLAAHAAPPPVEPAPAEPPETGEQETAASREPESAPTPPPPAPVQQVPATPSVTAEEKAATVAEPEPTPTSAPPPPTPEPPPAPPAAAVIAGIVSGAARAAVEAVVAYGPDNVVREAARATPAPDGSFSFSGLAPGRYRVVLAGKGGRVIESRPGFLTVTVGRGPVERRTIEAVRVR